MLRVSIILRPGDTVIYCNSYPHPEEDENLIPKDFLKDLPLIFDKYKDKLYLGAYYLKVEYI